MAAREQGIGNQDTIRWSRWFVTTHMLIICSYIMEQVCCLFLSIENSVTLSPSDVHSAWPSPRVPEMLEKTYEQILWEIPTGEANRAMPIDPPR